MVQQMIWPRASLTIIFIMEHHAVFVQEEGCQKEPATWEKYSKKIMNIMESTLVIQIRNWKNYLNIVVLSIDFRNKHWSQCFNLILIWSSGLSTICPAVVVQAALDSRAACTTTAERIVLKPLDQIKIRLKHCDQCLFLQSMLSATIFKYIF